MSYIDGLKLRVSRGSVEALETLASLAEQAERYEIELQAAKDRYAELARSRDSWRARHTDLLERFKRGNGGPP